MGFFSNLFKKEVKAQPTISITVTEKTEFVHNDPDIPPLQGDYAKTIFLWAHSKAAPIRANDSYARYFLYECGIRNPSKYHRGLITEGYFTEASVEQTLDSLKVTDLKEILSVLGESTTGKKDALVWRIATTVFAYTVLHPAK